MIKFTTSGNWNNTFSFLKKNNPLQIENALHKGGKKGVEVLSEATPSRSGKTAASWDYVVTKQAGNYRIDWINKNTNQGYNIAVLIQYGHGTGTGGYVRGIDYINPAMAGVFQEIADDVWREVTSK